MMIRASTTQLFNESIATSEYSFAGDQTQHHTGYAAQRREGNAGSTGYRYQQPLLLINMGANTIPVLPTSSQTDRGTARKKRRRLATGSGASMKVSILGPVNTYWIGATAVNLV